MIASANLYTVWEALVVVVGIMGIFGVIGLAAFAFIREDNDRSLIPWGARMRVERAKALYEFDAIEVKRLALEHQRAQVLAAIEKGDTEQVQALGLPSAATNGRVEEASWR